MLTSYSTIVRHTRGFCDIQDLTDEIQTKVRSSQIQEGMVCLMIPGSTAALTTIEYEEGVIQDLKEVLQRLVPTDQNYHHNRRWGDGNGFSHIRASLLGPSLCIPIHHGELVLGTWQQIILCDFDNRPRTREVVVQILGNAN